MVDFTGKPRPTSQEIHFCDNRQCPNRADAGTMALFNVAEPIVGGHRGMTLILCTPCSTALLDHFKGGSR